MHLHVGELHTNLVSLIRVAHSRGLTSFQLNCGSRPGSQKRGWAGCVIAEDSGKNVTNGSNTLQVSRSADAMPDARHVFLVSCFGTDHA
jgi:hypothetical protein